MPLSLDEYRCKLINKILFAGSQDEVKRLCNAAVKELEQNKINDLYIEDFAVRMISELEKFSPMEKDAQQWSNIRMAGIQFKHIQRQSAIRVG